MRPYLFRVMTRIDELDADAGDYVLVDPTNLPLRVTVMRDADPDQAAQLVLRHLEALYPQSHSGQEVQDLVQLLRKTRST